MNSTEVVLAAQAIASGMMCGIIWFVQVVHYPLFAAVPGGHGAAYAERNRRQTAWVVLPPMIVEAMAAVWLVIWPPVAVGRSMTLVSAAILPVLWLSTILVQMPLHLRLGREGTEPMLVGRLVAGNWLRTVLWSVRAVLAVWMLASAGR